MTIKFPSKEKPFNFWETLDESILNQPPRHNKDVSLYPSEAGTIVFSDDDKAYLIGGCQRKSWIRSKLQRKERDKEYQTKLPIDIVEEPFTPGEMWKFKVSSGVERDITDESERAEIYETNSHGFEYDLEVPGYPSALIRGEVDLVTRISKESDLKVGIEIKSISGYFGEKEVFGNKSQKGKPKENNLLQTILYTYIFCIVKKEFEYFKLVYMSRGNGKRAEFDIDLIPVDTDMGVRHKVYVNRKEYKPTIYAEDLLDNYRRLHKYIVDDEIPPRSYDLLYSEEKLKELFKAGDLNKTETALAEKGKWSSIKKGDWQCSYCNYKNFCYKDNEPVDFSNISEENE